MSSQARRGPVDDPDHPSGRNTTGIKVAGVTLGEVARAVLPVVAVVLLIFIRSTAAALVSR